VKRGLPNHDRCNIGVVVLPCSPRVKPPGKEKRALSGEKIWGGLKLSGGFKKSMRLEKNHEHWEILSLLGGEKRVQYLNKLIGFRINKFWGRRVQRKEG